MSGQSVSLGAINTKVEIITSNVTTAKSIPTDAVFAEVLLIAGGGGGGGGTSAARGGGGGEGARGWYRFALVNTTKYTCTIGSGGTGGVGGATPGDGTDGVDTTFTIKGGPADVTLTAKAGKKGLKAATGTGGGGGVNTDTQSQLVLFQKIAGDDGTTKGIGGGIGGGLGGANSAATSDAIANTGGGGGGGIISKAGGAGGKGYIQITWYFNTNSIVKLSEVDSLSYLFTEPATDYYFPAPLGAQSADIILIGGGGSGGSAGASYGGSGGGQGVISYSPIVIPQGLANEIIQVGTTTNNTWYRNPATWEKNAPPLNNGVYWIWAQPSISNVCEGSYITFYGIYNNTGAPTAANVSFGADDSAYVIFNGSVLITFASGSGGFATKPITLIPGNNTFIITAINTSGSGGTWLAVTENADGTGIVYYKTDSTWKYSSMYGVGVGAGATDVATNGGDTVFTLNNMSDTSSTTISLPNKTILTQFVAGGGEAGVNNSSAVVNSGIAIIYKNNVALAANNPNTITNEVTSISANGLAMYDSGSQGTAGTASGVIKKGGNGGSFNGGIGGTDSSAPTAGQNNGGGGGGGAGTKSGSTGANGGNGLALVTFYGGSSSLPISLYAVSTRTDIYTDGSGSSIPIPKGAYILKLILIGPGGNGGINTTSSAGAGGGSGALGMWIIPLAGIAGTNIYGSYIVGSPGTDTSFTFKFTTPIVFTAATGKNAGVLVAGGGGTAPSSPDNSVNMVTALRGADGLAGSSGGNGGGLYGGAGSGSVNGTNGGIGSGGGGCPSGKTAGTGGNGLIVATWYYKNTQLSLTRYTNGPYNAVPVLLSTQYTFNYADKTWPYTIPVPSGYTTIVLFTIQTFAGGSGGGGGASEGGGLEGNNGCGGGQGGGAADISNAKKGTYLVGNGNILKVTVGGGGTGGSGVLYNNTGYSGTNGGDSTISYGPSASLTTLTSYGGMGGTGGYYKNSFSYNYFGGSGGGAGGLAQGTTNATSTGYGSGGGSYDTGGNPIDGNPGGSSYHNNGANYGAPIANYGIGGGGANMSAAGMGGGRDQGTNVVAGLGAYTDLYHPLTRTRSDGPSSTDYTIGGCGGDSDNVTNEKGYSGGNGANGKIIIRIYYV